MCACASTDSTIVRTVARPAIYGWLIPMVTDPVRSAPGRHTECVLHEDARIIAGLRVIISHAAEQAALSERASEDLVNAVLKACQGMFAALRDAKASDQTLRVASTNFPDRVEVIIETSGKISPVVVDETRKTVAALNVDRAECEIIEGRLRVTLSKYADGARSNTQA